MRVTHGNKNRYTQTKLNRRQRRQSDDEYQYEPTIRYDTNQIWRSIPEIPNQGCLIQCNIKKRGGDAASDWAKFTNEFTNPDSLLNQTDDKIRDAYKKAEDELGKVFDPNKNGLREKFENFRDGMKGVFQTFGDKFKVGLNPELNGVNNAFRKFGDDWNKAFENIGEKMLDFYKKWLYPTPALSLLGRAFKPLGEFWEHTLDKQWWEDKLNDPETYFFIAQSILMCSSAFLGPAGTAIAAGVIAAARLITKAAMNEPVLVTDVLEMGLCLLPQGRLIAGPMGRNPKTFGEFVMGKVVTSINGVKGLDPNAKARAVGQGLCACVAVGQDIGIVPPINKKGAILTWLENLGIDYARHGRVGITTSEDEYLRRYTIYVRDSIQTGTEKLKRMSNGVEIEEDVPVYKMLNSFSTREITLDDFKDRDIIPRVLEEERTALDLIEFWKENRLVQQDIDDWAADDLTKDIPLDVLSGYDKKTGKPFYMARPVKPDITAPTKTGNIYLHIQGVPYKKGDFAAKTLVEEFMPPDADESAWDKDPNARVFECMKDIPKEVADSLFLPLPPDPDLNETFQSLYEENGYWRECTKEYANSQPGASTISDPRQLYLDQAAKYRELYNTMKMNERYASDLAEDRLIIQDRLHKDLLVKTDNNTALEWLTRIIQNEVAAYTKKRSDSGLDTSYMLKYHTDYWTNYFLGPNFFQTPEEGKDFYAKNPEEDPESKYPPFNADTYGSDFDKQIELHMERFFTVNLEPIEDTHACTHSGIPLDLSQGHLSNYDPIESFVCPFNEETRINGDPMWKTTPVTVWYEGQAHVQNHPAFDEKGQAISNDLSYADLITALDKEINRDYVSASTDADDRYNTDKYESSEAYFQMMFGMTRAQKIAHLRKLHDTAGYIFEGLARKEPNKLLKDSPIWNNQTKRIEIPSLTFQQAYDEWGIGKVANQNRATKMTMSESDHPLYEDKIPVNGYAADMYFERKARETLIYDDKPSYEKYKEDEAALKAKLKKEADDWRSPAVSFPWQIAPPLKIVQGKNDSTTLAQKRADYNEGVRLSNIYHVDRRIGANTQYSAQELREQGQVKIDAYNKYILSLFPLYPFPDAWINGTITLIQLHKVFQGVQLENPVMGVIPEFSEQYFINYFLNEAITYGKSKLAKERELKAKKADDSEFERLKIIDTFNKQNEIQPPPPVTSKLSTLENQNSTDYEYNLRFSKATPTQQQYYRDMEYYISIGQKTKKELLEHMRKTNVGLPGTWRPTMVDRKITDWKSFKAIDEEDRPYSQEDLRNKVVESIKIASVLLAGKNPDFFNVYTTNGLTAVIDYYMTVMKLKDAQEGTTINFTTATAKRNEYLAKVKKNYDVQRRIRKAKGLDETLSPNEILLKRIKEDPDTVEYEERYRNAKADEKLLMDGWDKPPPDGPLAFSSKIMLARFMNYGYNSDWRPQALIPELEQKIKDEDVRWDQDLLDEHNAKYAEIQSPWAENEARSKMKEEINMYETSWAEALERREWTPNMVDLARSQRRQELGLSEAQYEEYRMDDSEPFDEQAMYELLRLEDVRYAQAKGIREQKLLEDAYNEQVFIGQGKPKRRKYNKFYKY